MIVPIFSLKLNNKISPRTVAVGKYDGLHPCLTAATLAGKVFIHNPHQDYKFHTAGRSTAETLVDSSISLLNINAVVTSLATGMLDASEPKETLFVGTKTSLLAYDVNDNSDLYYKEIADGANAIVVGSLGCNIAEPVAIVGGNCSIMALNRVGEEVLWTVTGDNVCSLALLDFNADGFNELAVGSEDFDIRIFKDDEIINEMSETESIISLCKLSGAQFGYALANGSVGVYSKGIRTWRIKSKNTAMDIDSFDINDDGVPELITGWSNGKVDGRNSQTGEVVFKCNLEHSIAGVLNCDYKLDGLEQLICCSIEGDFKGFKPMSKEIMNLQTGHETNQTNIREMSIRKQNLMLELNNLEEASKPSVEVKYDEDGGQSTGIPTNTQIQSNLSTHLKSGTKPGQVRLNLATNNDTIIRAVIVFAEGIFKNESFAIHPAANKVKSDVEIPLVIPKDSQVDLHMQIFIGYENSTQFHVIEQTRVLPTFSMYVKVDSKELEAPRGFVSFAINERIQRIVIWINNNFILTDDFESEGDIHIAFVSARTSLPVVIKMETSGQITFQTDDMELAGLLVQSLVTFLNIVDLSVTCDFPLEIENLRQILIKVEQYNSVRQQLSSQMADHSNLIRSLVVRSEDSRLIDDIEGMKHHYMELMNTNRDLISGYKIRSTNHDELVKNVKVLNQIVQRAGNLRAGKFKTDVISNSRQAIKQNNTISLIKIIKTGTP